MAWKYLQYDGETGKKRTVNGGSGGASVLNDLDDVNVSNPSNGQVLKYDANAGEWVNSNESGGGGNVSDVTVGGVSVVNQQGVAEIPAIPDGLHHYSTTEKVVGTWIDNKPIYEKTVDFGALPDSTGKTVNHGISNLDTIISYDGVTKNQNSTTFLPLPRVAGDSQYNMDIYFTDTQIIITALTNRSAHSAYIIMRYTKTTD